MSAAPRTAAPAPAAASAGGRQVGFGRLVQAEWTKIRSVRSTFWTLIIFVVVTIGFTGLITFALSASWNHTRPAQRVAVISDPVSVILGTGLSLGQLAICVLGVLIISSEYSSGTIRSSLLAVPRRHPMLAAKLLVTAVLVTVAGEVVAFGSFFVGAAILHSHAPVALSDPGVTRAIVGAGLYLGVLGLFSLAIGALLRHTPAAISTAIGVVFVLPIIAAFLPGNWGQHVHDYLPSAAGQMIAQAHQGANQVLTPWQGFGVFCLWTAALIALAFSLFKTRDA